MARRKEFSDGCSICGKKMYYGDNAYATTTGSLEESAEGFAPSDCGEKIGEAISDLIEKKRKEAHSGTNT